jgi:hypothetical protein
VFLQYVTASRRKFQFLASPLRLTFTNQQTIALKSSQSWADPARLQARIELQAIHGFQTGSVYESHEN